MHFSPFGGWRYHLSPSSRGALWVLSNGVMSLQESIERFILSPGGGGESPAKPDKGEASAASQSAELFSCHMTLKVNPVTLTL